MRRICVMFLAALALPMLPVFPQSISGRVTDPRQNPIPELQLTLLREGRLVATAHTDVTGHYQFEHLKPGTYALAVKSLGFRQQQTLFDLAAGEEVNRDLVLELEELQEQVVVTATRTETSTSLLGNSVTVVTADEIRAQNATSIAEVLRNVPGVNIVQSGGRGGFTSVFTRGGESDYTKVMLDGIPLNNPGGAINLSNLTTANIERIEIVRGAHSALEGSDAVSGVIQIFTKTGAAKPRPPQVDLFLEGGKFETGRGGGAVSGGFSRISYSAEFQHLSTNNESPNEFFRNNTVSASVGIETSADSSLSVVARSERSKSGVPGPTAFGPADPDEFFSRRNFAVGVTWNQQVSAFWQQKLSYSQSYDNQLSEDPADSGSFVPEFQGRTSPFPSFDFPFSFQDATRKHDVNYQSDFFFSTHQISAGFNYTREEGVVGDVRADRDNFGYYVQDQFVLGRRLALTAGVRLEDNDSFGFFAAPRVSASYLLRKGADAGLWGMTRFKFNFGLGIKEPSFVESFSPNFFFKGNPDLDPERSTSFEVGVEQESASGRLHLEVNAFYNRFKDQVAFEIVDFNSFEGSFFNLGESQSWGLENIVEARLRQGLKLSGSYTYTNSRVLTSNATDPAFQEGARLLRRPFHSGSVGLTWQTPAWTVNSNATIVGSRADSDFLGLGLTEAGAYTKWDLSATYRVNPYLDLYADFENILDDDHFEVLGFPALKFNFRSGLRLHLPTGE